MKDEMIKRFTAVTYTVLVLCFLTITNLEHRYF